MGFSFGSITDFRAQFQKKQKSLLKSSGSESAGARFIVIARANGSWWVEHF